MKPFILNAASSTDIRKQSSDEANANSKQKLFQITNAIRMESPLKLQAWKMLKISAHISSHRVLPVWLLSKWTISLHYNTVAFGTWFIDGKIS